MNFVLFWSLTTHFTLNWLFYRRKFKEVGKNYTRQCQIWSSFDCKELYHFRKIPYSWSYVWQTCENIRVLEFKVVYHGFKYKLHEVNKYCSSKHYNISKTKWFNYWFFFNIRHFMNFIVLLFYYFCKQKNRLAEHNCMSCSHWIFNASLLFELHLCVKITIW